MMIAPRALSAAEETLSNYIKPYGNLYMFLGYKRSATYDAADNEHADNDLVYNINDNSNLGMRFEYEKYSGVFELGFSDFKDGRIVKIRKAYGVYTFDYGKLMIGQDWNPYVQWSHDFADYSRSKGLGALSEEPCIQFKYTIFGFYIDLIRPNIASDQFTFLDDKTDPAIDLQARYELRNKDYEATTGLPLDQIQAFIPKIAIGYQYEHEIASIGVGVAGNFYYVDNKSSRKYNKDWIISYLVYLNTEVRFWIMELHLNAGFSVNPANFGIDVETTGNDAYPAGAALAIHNVATGKYEIKDTWNTQGYFEMGFKAHKMVSIYLGYGICATDYPVPGAKLDLAMEYYFNVKINIAGLIALTPSFCMRDYMEDFSGDKEGYDITAGILGTVSFY